MEILPTLISLHTLTTRARSNIAIYTSYIDLQDCLEVWSRKKTTRRDNTRWKTHLGKFLCDFAIFNRLELPNKASFPTKLYYNRIAYIKGKRFCIGFDWKGCFVSQLLPIQNPFFAILGIKWVATAEPLAHQLGTNWVPIGTQLATIHD